MCVCVRVCVCVCVSSLTILLYTLMSRRNSHDTFYFINMNYLSKYKAQLKKYNLKANRLPLDMVKITHQTIDFKSFGAVSCFRYFKMFFDCNIDGFALHCNRNCL